MFTIKLYLGMKKDLEDVLLKTFKISSKDGETVKIFSGGELCGSGDGLGAGGREGLIGVI